jgi:hypothetical protein
VNDAQKQRKSTMKKRYGIGFFWSFFVSFVSSWLIFWRERFKLKQLLG